MLWTMTPQRWSAIALQLEAVLVIVRSILYILYTIVYTLFVCLCSGRLRVADLGRGDKESSKESPLWIQSYVDCLSWSDTHLDRHIVVLVHANQPSNVASSIDGGWTKRHDSVSYLPPSAVQSKARGRWIISCEVNLSVDKVKTPCWSCQCSTRCWHLVFHKTIIVDPEW